MPERVLVKCGGFSTQLANNVTEKVDGDPLWGSRFDYTNPEAVIKTYLDFLRNGADIILTNTYQASVEGYEKHLNMTRSEAINLIKESVELAKKAKLLYLEEIGSVRPSLMEEFPLILASIGPFGAFLHDGSEYNGSYADSVSKIQLQQWHRPRIETCLSAGVDGLAVETIPCVLEATTLTELILRDYPTVKFWVSFQCQNGTQLAHGEDFASSALSIWEMVKTYKAIERLYGIGVNCLNPHFVAPLFSALNAITPTDEKIPLLVYSNRGETYDSQQAEWTGGEECTPIKTFVPNWLNLGARIIGGCCRVYPADILQIRKCIDNIGNNN